jgi:hypothetical protein
VLLLILDIDEFFALLTLSDVTATVSLVKVYPVHRKEFVAVAALLRFGALLHFQLVFKL